MGSEGHLYSETGEYDGVRLIGSHGRLFTLGLDVIGDTDKRGAGKLCNDSHNVGDNKRWRWHSISFENVWNTGLGSLATSARGERGEYCLSFGIFFMMSASAR